MESRSLESNALEMSAEDTMKLKIRDKQDIAISTSAVDGELNSLVEGTLMIGRD